MRRLRIFCDSRSWTAGGVGIIGRFRIDEYEGGVACPCDVDGRPPASKADVLRRLALDARSARPVLGDACLDEDRRSFIRLSRNRPSNRTRRS